MMNISSNSKMWFIKIHTLLLIILINYVVVFPEEVCKISYTNSPEYLQDTTIIVPEGVVALSDYIYVPPFYVTITIIRNLSLFFIIDHSSSMYTNSGKDVWGNRFRITCDIIDSLKNRLPKSEIGISVFTEYLYFRPEASNEFVQCSGIDSGAYLPLFHLDSSYAGSGGKLGSQILKEWMETDTVTETIAGGTYTFVDLKYRPDPLWDDWQNGSNSNISVGFEAAKHAFQSATYPKSQQYIIFISDGEVSPATNPTDFIQGVNTPTTYTVFFVNNPNDTPQQLIEMNTNIQYNGYSTSNPRSQLWEYNNSSYEQLMQFLMHNLISIISTTRWAYPIDIVVNDSISPITIWDSIGYYFAKPFPLMGETTSFNYDIDYVIAIDSITQIGDTIITLIDTSKHMEFEIKVESDAPDLPPTFFKVERWDRILGFYYKNIILTEINKSMNSLEIRFTEKKVDILYDYQDVSVIITNTKGDIDSETFTLSKTDSCFTKFFAVTVDSTPIQNDGILQVYERDTVTALFKNPKLPLDTIKLSVPFYPTTEINPNTIFSKGKFSFFIAKTGSKQNILRVYNLPENGKVSLYAVNGRKIFERSISRGNSSFRLPKTLSQAIYFLNLEYSNSVIREKILLH